MIFGSALTSKAIALSFNLAEPNLRLVVTHLGVHLVYREEIGRVPPFPAWPLSGRLRAGLTPQSLIQAGVSRPLRFHRAIPLQPEICLQKHIM